MPREINQITQEGYDKLLAELEELRSRRPEIAEEIKVAREFGDLSENAEYDAAKDAQGLLETRIALLEERLQNLEIVKKVSGNQVSVGSKVNFKDEKSGEKSTYTVVNPLEADIAEGKLSTRSPIGQALLGASKGDVVEATLPSGKKKRMQVTSITQS